MSVTSSRGGRTAFSAALLSTPNAIDPYITRDYIANNILHAADQTAARVLINYVSPDDTYISGNDPQSTSGVAAGEKWYPIATFGPFPLSVRDRSGTLSPYALRVALAGAAGGEVAECFFAVKIGTATDTYWHALGDLVAPRDCMTFASTTSTAPAWLTPDEPVIEVSNGLLSYIAGTSGSAFATLDEPSGGPTLVPVHAIGIRVFARSVSAAATPLLYGLHVAEYHS